MIHAEVAAALIVGRLENERAGSFPSFRSERHGPPSEQARPARTAVESDLDISILRDHRDLFLCFALSSLRALIRIWSALPLKRTRFALSRAKIMVRLTFSSS